MLNRLLKKISKNIPNFAKLMANLKFQLSETLIALSV